MTDLPKFKSLHDYDNNASMVRVRYLSVSMHTIFELSPCFGWVSCWEIYSVTRNKVELRAPVYQPAEEGKKPKESAFFMASKLPVRIPEGFEYMDTRATLFRSRGSDQVALIQLRKKEEECPSLP